jgi:hypothetical protein
MCRVLAIGIALVALLAAPLASAEDEELREEVERLREKVAALESGQVSPDRSNEKLAAEVRELRRRAAALEAGHEATLRHEVERYLGEVAPESEAQGGDALKRITIDACLTGVALATVGSDPSDTHSFHGNVELDFDFAVTENLRLFLDLTANDNNAGAFPASFGAIAGPGGATVSGLVDGIGVDGTVSIAPGSIAAEQWGFAWTFFVRDQAIEVMGGRLDPRDYYATNAFADDARTQFLNNLFDDPAAIDWPTNATGTTIYGLRFFTEFAEAYSFDIGWYNTPGPWFDHGLLLFEFAWRGQLQERDFHLRVYAQLNTASSDPAAGFGISFDWYATERIGVFGRATIKDNQPVAANAPNQVESDWQLGAAFFRLIPGRPDDEIGVAFGYMKGPIDAIIAGAPENNEGVVEVYYKLMLEGGKLQVTFDLQFVFDAGAGTFPNGDNLFLLGVRLHIPF